MDTGAMALPGNAFRNKYAFRSEPGITGSILDGYRVYPVAGVYNDGDTKSAIVNALLYLLVRGISREQSITRWLMVLQEYPRKLEGIPSNHLLAIKFSECQDELFKQCTHLIAILLLMGTVPSATDARRIYDTQETRVLEPLYSELRRLQSFKWNTRLKKYKSRSIRDGLASCSRAVGNASYFWPLMPLWTWVEQSRRHMARIAALDGVSMPKAPSRSSFVRYNKRPELTRRIKYARTKE